ncbi:putative sugar transporter [Nitzschia inconspicua]|uniref:Sugar transporter n=1 Tax=Nitzschia inconspicua TaxID=303405 RepID=A0A9K3LQE5_9STRA|nr:putative sugar transporter [Nitzschia inconspicua]
MSRRWKGYSSLFGGAREPQHHEADDDGEPCGTSSMELSRTTTTTTTSDLPPLHSDEEVDDYVLPNQPPPTECVNDRHDHLNSNEEPSLDLDIEDAIDRLGMGRFQYSIVFACGLCFAADAMEILLLSFLAVILEAEWGLSEGQVDSIISVVFAGAMLGTLVLSSLGDRWGRRPVFSLTAALISIFGVATAFCTTYEQVVLARFLVGFGVGGLTVPYDALSEFMPTSYRGTNLLSTSFFWTGGSLLVPLFAWMTLGSAGSGESEGTWRAFVALCAIPCIFSTILGIFLVPESPRWLLTRGKSEKALRILRQAAAKNGRDPFLTFPTRTRLTDHNSSSERSMSTVTLSIEEDKIPEKQRRQEPQTEPKNNCWMLCSNPQWRKMSLLLCGQWYGLAFMYYGAIMAVSIVFSNASKNQDSHIDGAESGGYSFDYSAIFISSSSEIIGLTLAILTVDRCGRVWTQVWSYVSGGLCILVLGLLEFYSGGGVQDEGLMTEAAEQASSTEQENQQEKRRHLIVFAFLARMFIMSATSVTWLHTSELLPTEIRATGHGLANAMGRIGGITSPFIISGSTSIRTIGIVMCLVSMSTAVFTWCLPETAGKALGSFEDDNLDLELFPDQAVDRPPLIAARLEVATTGWDDDDLDDDSGNNNVDGEENDASSFELL